MRIFSKKIFQKHVSGNAKKAFANISVRILQLGCYLLLLLNNSLAQEPVKTLPDGTDGSIFIVRKEDSIAKELPPNEFNGSITTFKIGLGFIHDFAAYSQSATFRQQMDSAGLEVNNESKPRDFRVLGSGVFRTKRQFSWKFAYMYDGDKDTWLVRESGLTIGVPELAGHIFIGRTKEGYSMVKVMNGHSPWTAERQMSIDVIPILADGIKWFGFLPKSRLFWNLGYFNDIISKGQGFSTFQWQYVARVGWLAIYNKETHKVLHIATNLRYGRPNDGKISLRSRPESNPAPQILNTGTFDAEHSNHIGAEIYYSADRLLIGSEVNMHNFTSSTAGNHSFVGGDVVITYFLTKTKRPYTTVGSIFGFVKVNKSIFKGGWGEFEAVLRLSALDLDDGNINGGKFWRLTPMINWYMTKGIRTEFVYGYGVFDKYNLKGDIQFFQARIQFTFM